MSYEDRIRRILDELGVAPGYGRDPVLPLCGEAAELVPVGPDMYGREQSLAPRAADAWRALRAAAAGDGVALQLVSAYRSVDYQRRLVARKLDAGIPIESILRVNTAPGYSEHHTGRAVDLSTPGSAPLEEEFEDTAAFRWLVHNAVGFGFTLSYPRGNAYGIIYEPWHWAFAP